MADKIKLTITEVKESIKVGDKGAEKLSFKAKDPDGKDYWYFTFSKRLFSSIQKDKEIEADVDISSHDFEGNTYIDRKVTEVYVDGKSVAPKSSGGYGGGYRTYDKASIEAQVAFKGVIELMTHDVVTKKDKLGKMAMAWAMEKMGAKETPETVKFESDIEQAEKDVEELFEPDTGNAKEAAQPPKEPIDMDWLKESLLKAKFPEKTAVSWIVSKFKVKGGLLEDVLPRLTKEQQEEFVKEIQDRLDMV